MATLSVSEAADQTDRYFLQDVEDMKGRSFWIEAIAGSGGSSVVESAPRA